MPIRLPNQIEMTGLATQGAPRKLVSQNGPGRVPALSGRIIAISDASVTLSTSATDCYASLD